MVIQETKYRLSLIEIDESTNKIIDYYKEKNEQIKELKKFKNEIEKLDRKKSVLYRKKCEKIIKLEEFKTNNE